MGRCGAKVQRALQKLHQGIVSGLHHHHHHHHGHGHNAAMVVPGSDAEEDKVPSDVPAGFLVVYVGEERRRFVIKAKVLKHETFRVLLEKSAEEFGYKHEGGLIIACDVAFFQHLLQLIETKSPSLCRMQLRDYWAFAPDNTTYHMVD
ncbi:hypothetical protein M758_1G078300 [Ceratodon purpureus]|uniref:Uncharacterized protein n=1 Tax=Ceratodon purpureus TaxID=3225 RepID=A0A8T0J4X1_CERPU|nr:hypothetical protein KC19_1G080200 [Ceratodon purpureus]KAG0629121.1 hypothetical protein M758_1G078300 [Ceratodon purpureus]